MKLLNPTLTVQNTDTTNWLVTMQHAFSEHESIAVTLLVPRMPDRLPLVQAELLRRASSLLSTMASEMDQKTT